MLVWRRVKHRWRQVVQQRLQAVGGWYLPMEYIFHQLLYDVGCALVCEGGVFQSISIVISENDVHQNYT